jgi:FdhD protein
MNDSGHATRDALRIAGQQRETFVDAVVDEVPVALSYNGTPHAVMLATPRDLADFALGFSLTEGVIERAQEFELIDVLSRDGGIVLEIAIPARRYAALETRQRSLSGKSGCGLCGVTSLADAMRPVRAVDDATAFDSAGISRGLALLAERQPLNARTGGVHAAGFVRGENAGAERLTVREDVGRHNALDKLAGALARIPRGPGYLIITSRASYEIVSKTAAMGIGLVAAISAPTTLAIDTAERAGITLIAFARGDAMNVYTHPARVL